MDSTADYNWSDKVLLLEEADNSNYELMIEILAPTNIKIIHVKNHTEAIEIIRSDQVIHLILINIHMLKKLEDEEFTSISKKLRPEIPIIAQTAFTLRDDEINYKPKGCDDFVPKPYSYQALIEKLDSYFNRIKA